MISQTPFVRAWRARVATPFVVAFAAMTALAQPTEALFPQPLHITRRVEDPLSGSAATVHEYCAGNQVVVINGDKITISDYGRQELTEIDRAAGTYSVTRFSALAEAISATTSNTRRANVAAHSKGERWKTAAVEPKVSALQRSSDAFEVTFDDATAGPSKIEVALDRNVHLSKAALEVLIGASFPHPRSDVHEAILGVASRADHYALPIEQSVTFQVDNEAITVRSTVLDVRSEVAPPGAITIPPGARLVESHTVRLARELREVDQLPNVASPRP